MNADQNRREFKFVLRPGLLAPVRESVGQYLAADRGATEGYPVISEYFDSAERNSYWQKIFGVPNRRRVRGRVYGRADGSIPPSAFVEVKHKLDGITMKRRLTMDLDKLRKFSGGIIPKTPIDPREGRVLAEVHSLVTGDNASPVVQIRYLRYAYDSGPEGTIRITFDTGLCCRFKLRPLEPDCQEFNLPLLEEGASIMEVKTIGAVPFWFRGIIGKFSLVPRGFSKYATALEIYELRTGHPAGRGHHGKPVLHGKHPVHDHHLPHGKHPVSPDPRT